MIRGRKVLVNDGNTEKALRKFKKIRWNKFLRDQSLPEKLY